MDNHHHLNVIEFLQDLEARGERLQLVDGRLHYSSPQGSHPREEDIQIIQSHRSELMDWLQETANQTNEYPLSAGQQGLWMAWRLEPETSIYNLFFVARLQENVDIDALQQALQLLVEHHPVLRSRFSLTKTTEDSLPLQYIDEASVIDLHIQHAENWTDSMVDTWIEQESSRAFDLLQEPVMRTSVLQLRSSKGISQHLFHWTIHHIASDFLTQEVLIEDLESLYRSIQTQLRVNIPKAKLSYREFVRWEQDVIHKEGEALQNYWQSQVKRWPPKATLPADLSAISSDENDNYRSATFDFELDATLANALHDFTQCQQISLFTFLLSAYQIVIARYSGRDRFLVTTPTSVRHLSGWDRTAGYLINPLCLEADLSGKLNVTELLERTQQHLGSAFEHQMLPFSEILRMLQSAESSSQSNKPTFGFILDSARQPARAPSLFAETLAIGQNGTPEEISLSMFNMAGELSGQVSYNANRFLPHSIKRLVSSLLIVIRGMLDNPKQAISELAFLSSNERERILSSWASTTMPTIQPDTKDRLDLPLHVQFLQQVERTPNAVALIDASQANEAISYQDLNHQANKVAHQLRAQGTESETLVGICLERSIAMVAALLGILKAGATYLPLDPSYPQTRLAYMLSDSGASFLITNNNLRDKLPTTDTSIIDIDHVIASDVDLDDEATVSINSTDLAYVIYTSGSTGQPKGVQMSHRATSNRLVWMWRTMPFTPDEVCCQKTALSFVDSVWEIFGPLLQGVPSVIIPSMVTKDVPRLVEVLAHHKVSRIVLVPSLLRAMLSANLRLQKRLPLLQHWVCSGETLPAELVQQFYTQHPKARLINLYGSSEVAADVTCYDTTAFETNQEYSLPWVPIGQPIDNTQCYILDDQLNPVPPGIEGELYVGGECLARGYHQQPEMTRERFISNPFDSGRLFRTGDRARWLPMKDPHAKQRPDIEFLGRNDTQVKVRGFRVELTEIEARLRNHADVDDAIVQLQEHSSGARLAAFVVTAATHLSRESLYWSLQQDLPEHMVPSVFVMLESFPLTPNGKVDRQSLAQWDISEQIANSTSEPPATELEQLVADIWTQRLGLMQQVGRHDNFFVLGGHSLLATQIVSQIQNEHHVVLPLHIVFDHPTVSEFAKQIETRQVALQLQNNSVSNASDELDILL